MCSAFSISTNQVDRFSGPCEVLIGVKAQSLQISKVARFKSSRYPNVGLYTSPLLSKLIFVGADTPDQNSVSFCTTTSVFRCETMDFKLDQFLQSEKTLTLTDVLCDSCYRAAGDCPNCRGARSDSTLIEIVEDPKIKEQSNLRK